MSNLEELIERLCPDGVEYKTLGEFSSIVRGASPRPIKNYITSDEKGVNWIKIGDVRPGEKYITTVKEKITLEGATKSRFVNIGDFILSNSMSFGRPYILKVDGCIHDGWLAISQYEDFYDRDFLYYLLCSSKVQAEFKKKASFGGAVQNLNSDIVKSVTLPVPPLEVQREIVRILDNFTFLTTELAAELAARHKQYEYYRNSLLTFEDIQKSMIKSIPWVKLDNIIEFKNGKGHEKCINENGQYIVVNSKFISTNGRVKKFSDQQLSPLYNNDILMVMSDLPNGQALAKTYLVKENSLYTLNQRICALTVKNKNYSTKFLFYYLNRNKQLLKYDNGVDQTNLKKGDILTVIVPVISLAEQQRIVDILDRFDALCNDISSGLPAEIEARQKQYEYYRDKLLTFKELKKEA